MVALGVDLSELSVTVLVPLPPVVRAVQPVRRPGNLATAGSWGWGWCGCGGGVQGLGSETRPAAGDQSVVMVPPAWVLGHLAGRVQHAGCRQQKR